MNTIIEFNILAQAYVAQASSYNAKPTKAAAKRMRDLINQIQKHSVITKKALVELDKAGY